MRREEIKISGADLQDFALEKARNIGVPFQAGTHWLHSFKKRYGWSSRKITKRTHRTRNTDPSVIRARIDNFHQNFSSVRSLLPMRLIWNFDQSGYNYEMAADRTMSLTGERDTLVRANSSFKTTHSYTVTPMISRDGRVIGKLHLCMRETNGVFGTRVEPAVRRLERQFGNIKVVASKSGKLSSRLMDDWKTEVLIPAIEEEDGINCNEYDELKCPNYPPRIGIVADAWSGQKDFLNNVEGYIRTLVIPERTTGFIQPLDVGFNRQHKLFIKEITWRAFRQGLINNITDREGIIKAQALIWNQFSSPAYRDMLRYAWHSTDPDYDFLEEQIRHPPATVRNIQFGFDKSITCEVDGCEHHAFIRCSHCGKHLCLTHFLNATCFHDTKSNDDNVPYDVQSSSSEDDNDHYFNEEDDNSDLDVDLLGNPFGCRSTLMRRPNQSEPNMDEEYDSEC